MDVRNCRSSNATQFYSFKKFTESNLMWYRAQAAFGWIEKSSSACQLVVMVIRLTRVRFDLHLPTTNICIAEVDFWGDFDHRLSAADAPIGNSSYLGNV
jgi:hypothetical protein